PRARRVHPLHRGRHPLEPDPLPLSGDSAALLGDRDARSPGALSAQEGRMSTLVAEATATPTALPPGPRTPRLWQSVRYALWPYATVEMASRRWGERYTAASIGERGARFVVQATGPRAPCIALKPFQLDLGRLPPWGRFVRNRDAIRAVLLDEIARRRAAGTAGRSDILSLLVDARDEQGAPMSDAELLDEMFTLLMAGQETTATSLAWVF